MPHIKDHPLIKDKIIELSSNINKLEKILGTSTHYDNQPDINMIEIISNIRKTVEEHIAKLDAIVKSSGKQENNANTPIDELDESDLIDSRE